MIATLLQVKMMLLRVRMLKVCSIGFSKTITDSDLTLSQRIKK